MMIQSPTNHATMLSQGALLEHVRDRTLAGTNDCRASQRQPVHLGSQYFVLLSVAVVETLGEDDAKRSEGSWKQLQDPAQLQTAPSRIHPGRNSVVVVGEYGGQMRNHTDWEKVTHHQAVNACASKHKPLKVDEEDNRKSCPYSQ